MSPLEGLLNAITNPAVAAILLTLGLNALLFELSSPGGYVAGIIGVICLLLALYALGALEANWIGLGFVALAFLLFALDIKAPTHGALTAGGVISFIFGLYLLFNRSAAPVPWPTIIFLAGATVTFFVFAIAQSVKAQRSPHATGIESLVGRKAEVRQALDPDGMIFIEGELWRARLEAGAAAIGEEVVVIGHEGNTLHVRRPDA
jgi:membrane-bound serine protease (ClpP class)